VTEPLVFEPSSLLHHSKVNLPAAIRRGACAVACLAQDWDSIETIAQQAHRRWVEDGDWQSSAVALMHLGDDTLKAGNPTLARKYYDLSRHLFSLRVAPTQRQNEAAALYGMGLAETALGHEDIVIERFEKARRLLAEARRDWLTLNNDNRVTHCEKARARLKTMIKRGVAQPAAQLMEKSAKPLTRGPFDRDKKSLISTGTKLPQVLGKMSERERPQSAEQLAEYNTKPPLPSHFIKNSTDFIPVDFPALMLE